MQPTYRVQPPVDERQIAALQERSAEAFRAGYTEDLRSRRAVLDRLAQLLRENEGRIIQALEADFSKHRFETWISEIGTLLQELYHTRKHLRGWMRPRRVPTPFYLRPARSRIVPEPLGSVLVIAPWNYPVYLALAPAIGALAAGNTVVLKPSELTPVCSALLAEILPAAFEPGVLQVAEGGAEVAQALLARRWDYVFFTGSPCVGREVYKAAAAHGTPVTLELGGKNPCVIAVDADLKRAAARIVWGKFLNAGQTCIAPDYLLVERPARDPDRYERVLEALCAELRRAYGETPLESPDLASIVSRSHYDRLVSLLAGGRVRWGANHDGKRLRIEPTIIDDLPPQHPLLQEEIFGPILPVLPVESLAHARDEIARRPEGLAAYYFGAERRSSEILERARFGGGCSNDTLVHLGNPELPFGGRGATGIGRYHGRYSFETFSHLKSLLYVPRRLELPWRYAPYGDRRLRLLKRILG